MVVPLHSPFTLTCRGEAKLVWETPLDVPEIAQEDNSGLFVTTITVDNATAMHTGYYTCFYSRNNTEDTEDRSIYVYVPGMGYAAALSLCVFINWLYYLAWGTYLTPNQIPMFRLCHRRSLLATMSCLTTRRWRSNVGCLIPVLTWRWSTLTPSSRCLVFMTAREAL